MSEQKKKRYVIYTAIFGKFDELQEPKRIPEDCDFICFTDQPFKSKVWQIRHVAPPVPGDGTRSNRYYKMMPHKFFQEYEISAYIDGNVQITGNIFSLAEKYLNNAVMAGVEHATYPAIPLHSLKEHVEHLTLPGQENKHGEDFSLIRRQFEHYSAEGFPDTSGVLWTMTLLRRHNDPGVMTAMEAWWKELNTWSKRDQMSFNYVAWKYHLNFRYIPFQEISPQYIFRRNHHIPRERLLWNYILGAIKRMRRIMTNT